MAKKTKSGSIPKRNEVAVKDTWDLTPLFKSDAAWERAYKRLEKEVDKLGEFRGTLGRSAKRLREAFDFEVAFDKQAERVGHYAFLKASEDVSNSKYQAMVQRYIYLATRAQEIASYMAPEIQAIPAARMKTFLNSKELAPYRFALEKLVRYKPHILSEKEERLLAMQGEVAGTASTVFSQLNDADLRFGIIKDDRGRKVELSQSSLSGLLESRKRRVRREAFHQFYAEYEAHANTLSATLGKSVLQDVYQARVRNHASAREAALFADNVPVSVYDNLIQTVHEHLPVVHRYLDVRRKALKLKSLHFYDTYVPLAETRRVNIPYDKAVKQLCESLEPLGDGYVKVLHKGLTEDRWVDRYENAGKRSGAFSSGGYIGPPYILMNYKKDTLNGIFTLAHEAGHSMHTYFSTKAQPYQYHDYTIFVAEVASTFNEQLLGDYMRARAKSKAMKAYLVNKEIDEIRGTLVRQTMFAEFEKVIHELAEAGQPLTLEVFRDEYKKLIEAYFGPDFALDDELTLEGLRIPHFYSAFYVYKYATGISAAIALHERVTNGGKAELDAYLNFLKSGGSKFPLDLLRDAGVDMEQPEPVAAAMQRMSDLVDELEELL